MIHGRHDIALLLTGFFMGVAVTIEVVAWWYRREIAFYLED